MGEDKLGNYMRVNYGVVATPEEVHQVYIGYFTLYDTIQGWQDRSMSDATRLGYTETPWGRRRKFEQGDVHAAINTPIQSTASDFTLLAMVNVARRYEEEGVDAVVIGFVHDSILVDAADDDAERAAAMLVYEMENVDTSEFGFKMPISLPAEPKISEHWS